MRLPGWLKPLVVVVALLCRGLPAVATTANDVCTGDPCVLARAVDVTPGSILDFGARAFRIAPNGRLSAGAGDTLVIRARTITLQPGALIRGPITVAVGVTIRIETTQDILIQRSGQTRARIEVQGRTSAGLIELTGRNVDLAGELRADGTTIDASGGEVEIAAAGALTMTGDINASGGLAGSGGSVGITTGGALVASGIDVSGGSDGGFLTLTSGGALTTTGVLNASGTAGESAGGDVTLDAEGTVVIGARIAAQGTGSLTGGGIGGDVTISADGNVLVNERIETFAGGPDGEAGFINITAGADLTQTQPIAAHGPGPNAGAGEIDLVAGAVLNLNALVDVHGATAGAMTGQGGTRVNARGEINADGEGGSIELTTLSVSGTQVPGPVSVSGNLHARATAGGVSGSTGLQGCDVTVEATGRLATLGGGALNRLQSSRQMTIAGAVAAGPPGTNRFEHRDPALPPVVAPGAIVQPPAATQVNVTLLPCGVPTPAVCGNGMAESGETCDDDNTTACDGCSAACQLEACSNSMVECAEGCDDGNVVDGDGCDANCTTTRCGNGRLTAGEECDDGNQRTGDGCDAACRIEAPPGCGNGMAEPGEECDDDNTVDCDGCSRTCLDEGCGNNRVECGEVCDAGNELDCDGDGCAATCLLEELCGDGAVQCQEQCDAGPGNSQPGVGCNALCRLCALGTGDCPCVADTDCHQLGRCGGLACADGVCAPVEVPDCDDGNACNGVEGCNNGACAVGAPLQCADADVCTVDSCDLARGCLRTQATGLAAVSCRVEVFRLALDGAPTDQVAEKLRRRLDGAAAKLATAVDAAAGAGSNAKRQRRLLKSAERRANKLLRLIAKGLRKGQLPDALATTLRTAADGARTAAEGLRRDLSP